MQRLSPGVYRGQKGGLVQSKTGMIPKAKPKAPGVGMDIAGMANKMAGGQMKPTNVPNRNVQPMPRGGFGENIFEPMPRGGFGEGSFQPPMNGKRQGLIDLVRQRDGEQQQPNVLGGIVRPGGIPPMNPQGTPQQEPIYNTMPFNGPPQPGKGQPNMQDYLKQFDQGQADISGLEDLFGRMRGNMQMQGLLGSLNKGF